MDEIVDPAAPAQGTQRQQLRVQVEGRPGPPPDAAVIADALQALRQLQADAAARGLDTMGLDEIDEEIAAHRRERAAAKG